MGKSSAIRYDPVYCRRLTDYAITHPDDFQGTLDQISTLFGCSVRTISQWKKDHPEFREVCDTISTDIDIPVENANYISACGHEHQEVEEIYDGDDRLLRKKVVTKYYPPNPASISLWLTNRKPETYRNKQTTEHAGEIKISDERANEELAAILAEAEQPAESESSTDNSNQ